MKVCRDERFTVLTCLITLGVGFVLGCIFTYSVLVLPYLIIVGPNVYCGNVSGNETGGGEILHSNDVKLNGNSCNESEVRLVFVNRTIYENVTVFVDRECPECQKCPECPDRPVWSPPRNCSNTCRSRCHFSWYRVGERRCTPLQPDFVFKCHTCTSNCSYTGGGWGGCVVAGPPY